MVMKRNQQKAMFAKLRGGSRSARVTPIPILPRSTDVRTRHITSVDRRDVRVDAYDITATDSVKSSSRISRLDSILKSNNFTSKVSKGRLGSSEDRDHLSRSRAILRSAERDDRSLTDRELGVLQYAPFDARDLEKVLLSTELRRIELRNSDYERRAMSANID